MFHLVKKIKIMTQFFSAKYPLILTIDVMREALSGVVCGETGFLWHYKCAISMVKLDCYQYNLAQFFIYR